MIVIVLNVIFSYANKKRSRFDSVITMIILMIFIIIMISIKGNEIFCLFFCFCIPLNKNGINIFSKMGHTLNLWLLIYWVRIVKHPRVTSIIQEMECENTNWDKNRCFYTFSNVTDLM